MRLIKCGLESIVRNEESKAFFETVTQRVHEIKTASYMLCKLFMLEQFSSNTPLPTGKGALACMFKDAVNAVGGNSKTQQQLLLRQLCDQAFPANFKIDVSNLCNWPQYAAEAYASQVIAHVKRCYVKCLRKYLALTTNACKKELNGIVRDVMRKKESAHVPQEEAIRLVPQRELVKGYALYDIKLKDGVLDYLPCMLFMSLRMEGVGQRGFAIFPLIRTQIPGSVFIDTDTLLCLLPVKGKRKYVDAWTTPNKHGKRGQHSEKDFSDAEWARKQMKLYDGQAALWDTMLDVSKMPIHGGWTFDNRIQTDGVSVTLYAKKRVDQLLKGTADYPDYPDEDYVQALDADGIRACRNKHIVSIDPGKQNIIFAVNTASVRHIPGQGVQATKLRYTAKQRAFETKIGEARLQLLAVKATTPPLQGRSIDEWQAFLAAAPPRCSLDPAEFRRHIAAYYIYVFATRPFWTDVFHRQARLEAYRRNQKSEALLVKRFIQTFGAPDNVVIAFGDGATNNLSGRAPGPSTAIRRLFQRNHFRVLDVHEPYTSKRCFACKRPDANNEGCRMENDRHAWGVRRCCRCGTSWARDFNACLNIDRIAREHLAGLSRPEYLQAAAA